MIFTYIHTFMKTVQHNIYMSPVPKTKPDISRLSTYESRKVKNRHIKEHSNSIYKMRTIKFNEKKINDCKRNISINKTTTSTAIKLVNKTTETLQKS